MNIFELENAIKHICDNYPCPKCKTKYKAKNIKIIASNENEALLEIGCKKCKETSIVSTIFTSHLEINENPQRDHRNISKNDILDIKNFLTRFDGNFKKLFTKE